MLAGMKGRRLLRHGGLCVSARSRLDRPAVTDVSARMSAHSPSAGHQMTPAGRCTSLRRPGQQPYHNYVVFGSHKPRTGSDLKTRCSSATPVSICGCLTGQHRSTPEVVAPLGAAVGFIHHQACKLPTLPQKAISTRICLWSQASVARHAADSHGFTFMLCEIQCIITKSPACA